MKKILSLFVLLLGSLQLIGGSLPPADSLKSNPAQFSFIYPLGTLGSSGDAYVNSFSLNLLAGYNGALDGGEFGGLVNMNRYYAKGFQFAGIANLTGGEQEGVQMAGLVNMATAAEGFQSAGLLNLVSGKVDAVQMAGLANLGVTDLQGAQISGLLNTAGKVKGLQMAGLLNTAREVDGSQIAALINTTGKLKGLQLGAFNFVDSVESGTPVGFLSVVRKNGLRKLEVGTGDAFNAQASFKIGVSGFYNIFSIGYNAAMGERDEIIALGYGLGTQLIQKAKSDLGLELHSYAFQEEGKLSFSYDKQVNQLYQLRIVYGMQLSPDFGIYFGPTFNTLIRWNQQSSEQNVEMAPYTLFEKEFGNHQSEGWLGFNLGLRFF